MEYCLGKVEIHYDTFSLCEKQGVPFSDTEIAYTATTESLYAVKTAQHILQFAPFISVLH